MVRDNDKSSLYLISDIKLAAVSIWAYALEIVPRQQIKVRKF